jgi:hypothetical protein
MIGVSRVHPEKDEEYDLDEVSRSGDLRWI